MQLLTVQCDDTDDLDRDYEYCALDANTITHQKLAQIAAQEWLSRGSSKSIDWVGATTLNEAQSDSILIVVESGVPVSLGADYTARVLDTSDILDELRITLFDDQLKIMLVNQTGADITKLEWLDFAAARVPDKLKHEAHRFPLWLPYAVPLLAVLVCLYKRCTLHQAPSEHALATVKAWRVPTWLFYLRLVPTARVLPPLAERPWSSLPRHRPSPAHMRLGVAQLLLVLYFSGTHGHITNVCTASAATDPGRLHFLIGSYHGSAYGRGSLRIVHPDGSEEVFPFLNSAVCYPSVRPSRSGQPNEDHIRQSSSCGLSSDAIVQCYGSESGSESGSLNDPRRTKVVTGPAIFPTPSWAPYIYMKATINSIATGSYKVHALSVHTSKPLPNPKS